MDLQTSRKSNMTTMTIGVEPHSLEHHLAKDDSFPSAYLRVIGAIASSDGLVTLAEYSVVNEIANSGDESAVASITLLTALERPSPLKDALVHLKKASEGIGTDVRKVSFDAARPLLQLQGYNSRDLAKKLAVALAYDLSHLDLDEFPCEEDKPLLKKMMRSSMRLIRGKDLRNLADMCLSVTGDAKVSQCVVDYEDGLITLDQLRANLTTACVDVNKQIQSFKDQLEVAEFAAKATTAYLQTAQALKNQVAQRMAVVESRLAFERETFEEDMDYIIHDAGNAFSVEVTERLKTDQWKLARVWESIGRTTFAKELDSRIKRVVTRREEMLRLIKEDLRLFQEEMRITRISILRQQHHTRFRHLMPTLRVGTRVVNTVDSAASVTLGAGGVAIAGAGAATYFLGAAVVLPAILPAIPFIAVPMLLAAVFKWFSDSEGRKDGEIGHKREVFEKALREQLLQAQASFNLQLEAVAIDFQRSAVQMIQPIMLEAEAADRLAGLQVKMAKRLIEQSSTKVAMVIQAIPTT